MSGPIHTTSPHSIIYSLNTCRPVDDEENITDGDPDIMEDGEVVSDVDFDSDDSDSDDSDSDDSEDDQE